MIIVILTTIISITTAIVHHHGKSHPQIAGKSKASKDGQYRGEETKKTNQRFRTNLILHSLSLCERTEKLQYKSSNNTNDKTVENIRIMIMIITESDIEDAIRQKRIMTATLTRRFGVIESLDLSISQAGVEDTNLQMTYIQE